LVQRSLNAWRKGRIERDKYLEEKRKLRECMEAKQKKKGKGGEGIKPKEGDESLEIYK